MNAPLPALRTGAGTLTVKLVEGLSAVVAAEATDPLKLLVTAPRGACAWAFTTTYGGGLLAGDRVALQISVEAGAQLYFGSQASTKIYRSPEGIPARQHLQLSAGPGAIVVGLPDPVTPFAEAVHEQEQDLAVAADAGLIWLDGVTSGRAARDERWACTRHVSRLRLRVAGRLRILDALALERQGSNLIRQMQGYGAFATLLVGGPPCAELAERIHAEIAASPLPEVGATVAAPLLRTVARIAGWGVLVRFAAAERETLDRAVRTLLGDLRPLIADDPWQRRP